MSFPFSFLLASYHCSTWVVSRDRDGSPPPFSVSNKRGDPRDGVPPVDALLSAEGMRAAILSARRVRQRLLQRRVSARARRRSRWKARNRATGRQRRAKNKRNSQSRRYRQAESETASAAREEAVPDAPKVITQICF
jgi:hypothetical protein